MGETKHKSFALGSDTKVSVGLVAISTLVVLWIASHVLPTEAMVTRHETELSGAGKKLDVILEKVSKMEGKLEYLERKR